jgi:LacI family transcriptional regulator
MFNTERGGYQAAELLDQMMAGEVNDRRTILVEPLWVVTRQSTDVLAVDDREVAEALRFIRENARHPIGVDDVVRQLAVSRRAMEIRFRHALGRSIRSEIERVRLTRVKALLIETDLPAWRIAEMAGFGGFNHASKVFREETGTTMRAYRRDHRAS